MMLRSHAEHILDSYVKMCNMGEEDASNSLREVILDAMTSYYVQPKNITLPPSSGNYITLPASSGNFNTTIEVC